VPLADGVMLALAVVKMTDETDDVSVQLQSVSVTVATEVDSTVERVVVATALEDTATEELSATEEDTTADEDTGADDEAATELDAGADVLAATLDDGEALCATHIAAVTDRVVAWSAASQEDKTHEVAPAVMAFMFEVSHWQA